MYQTKPIVIELVKFAGFLMARTYRDKWNLFMTGYPILIHAERDQAILEHARRMLDGEFDLVVVSGESNGCVQCLWDLLSMEGTIAFIKDYDTAFYAELERINGTVLTKQTA